MELLYFGLIGFILYELIIPIGIQSYRDIRDGHREPTYQER